MVCGIVANLALILTLVLLPLGMILAAGFLGIFAADVMQRGPVQLPVLTLPGIAGILLTIGMAVDANVLIFERIREESGGGKRLWTAITAGYDRAFVTIIDANLTTLLTGIILFIFGSGPIRGFAVTLCAGILVSMFTALVVTKLLLGLVAKYTKLKELKMLAIIKATNIKFMNMRALAAIFSAIVILGSWAFLISSGMKSPGNVLAVDFTGGYSLTHSVKEEVEVETLRSALEAAGLSGIHVQYQRELQSGGDSYLQVKTSEDLVNGGSPVDVVRDVLAGYPQGGFVLEQEDKVGGQVGNELKKRAVKSIIMALLGIIVYLWIRFEFGFAVGAIVALAHDVLFTVGVYSLFGRQLSLPIVAALLTIVGYSVNDTIVVFDRIREDIRLVRNKSFKDICNLSINQTLSRTLLTSITTLITVSMLLVFGGGAINDFALALCIGILVGTYSSIFVATPMVLLWYRDRKPDFGKVTS
jgi:SecD/SecF fusion protein